MARTMIATTALVALVLSGCGGGGSKKVTVAGVFANDHGSKQVSGTAEVELDDDYFSPTVLQRKPGAHVTLDLKNDGKVEHNFSIDAQNVRKDLQPGASSTVTVTIPRSGQISFYCRYHRSKGMAGALQATGSPGGSGMTTTTNGGGGGYGY